MDPSHLPPSRHLDNRWNRSVDELARVWERLGPDRTLAWPSALAGSRVTGEGVVLLEISATDEEVALWA
jgi:hypothetical protein